MKFSELLIQTRKNKKMNKKNVAEIFGWTTMYYGRFENGYIFPSKSNIEKFANFIGISVSHLETIVNDEISKKNNDN